MTQPKRRRRLSAQALLWFLPGLVAVALAGAVTHPLTLIPLLLANALYMAASCHVMGFDLELGFARTVLRRGATYLVLFTLYTVAVFALVAWPMLRLHESPGVSGGMALAATLILAMGLLWRLWPTFGLVFVWDDAYPVRLDGSWIFTAAARSIAFGRHLSREERALTHFLPTAVALLVLAFGAIALAGLYGVLPTEMRTAALALYGIAALPLGCLVIANRTLSALLRERCEHAAGTEAFVCPESAAVDVDSEPGPVPADTSEVAEEPVQSQELLVATRGGDVERALALVAAGADVDLRPAEGDRDQRPVLMLAALLPDTRLLRALIAKGADVNRTSGGLTPLLAATRDSWHGRAEAVLTLLANGADPLLADGEGNTPLHGAVLSAEPGVAAMLLDAGAAIDALNAMGESPLSMACRAANWPLVEYLLEHGAAVAPEGGTPALVAAASLGEDDAQGMKLLLKQRVAVNAPDAQQRSALLLAAAEGHVEIARALCAARADVDAADAHGSTPLMEAARAGAGGVVELLLAARADVGRRDDLGRDALTLACQSPHAQAESIRLLLAHGATPDLRDAEGRSALDHAAAAGRWDLVALLDPQTPLPASLSAGLLPAGADTPAHLLDALRFGHWAIVSTFAERVREWTQAQRAAMFLELTGPDLGMARRWLLEHGLDPEGRLQPNDSGSDAATPAGAAEVRQDGPAALGTRLFDAVLLQLPVAADAAMDLLQAGASPAGAGLLAKVLAASADTPAASALTRQMLSAGADPFGPDERGCTPLHLAAAHVREGLPQTLLRLGCDPNVRDARGRTPLFAAIEQGADALPAVRALIAAGADPEAADANGETPLGLALDHPELERWLDWRDWSRPARPLRDEDLPAAAGAGALPSVRRLLELGFPVDARDAQGATALLRACGGGHAAVVDCLLDAGADPTLAAHSGATPLAAAVSARQVEVIALLLGRGVGVDQRLPNATTALMVAAALGYPEIVDVLLGAGAEVNTVDDHGRSALHAAAQFSFEHNDSLRARRLFDTLLKHGADVNHADGAGTTPLLLLLGAHMPPDCACDATHIGALVPLLLDAGAHGQHADHRGVTALHACAMHALVAPSRILLAHGADREALDGFSRTPADVARQLGYVDVAQELATRGSAVPSVRQTLQRPAQPAE